RLATTAGHQQQREHAERCARTPHVCLYAHAVPCLRYALAGSSGSMEGDPIRADCCTSAYTDGSTISVARVAAARPPITARPRGAVASAPSPKASAMGIMPAIIAALVINTGRMRDCAASMAVCTGEVPCTRDCSANVTSRIAFATATPIAMMAPMNDCTFSVV